MTARAVGSPPPIAAVSPSAPTAAAHDPAATPFEHQLHAARQRGAPAEHNHAPVREAHRGRSPDAARDRA
ncbi:MAG: hypothetical protein ABI386_10770, partial [Rhodanobacter sp.]